jgi:hypothetical protein
MSTVISLKTLYLNAPLRLRVVLKQWGNYTFFFFLILDFHRGMNFAFGDFARCAFARHFSFHTKKLLDSTITAQCELNLSLLDTTTADSFISLMCDLTRSFLSFDLCT